MNRTMSFSVTLAFADGGSISHDGVESNLRTLLEKAAEQNEFTHINAGDDHASVVEVDVTPGDRKAKPPAPTSKEMRDLLGRVLGFMEDSGDLSDSDRHDLLVDVQEAHTAFGGE